MNLVSSVGQLTVHAQRLMWWFAQAEAPTAGGSAPTAGGGATAKAAESPAWLQLAPLVVFGLIFYFLILRPQNQRTKKHKSFLDSLSVGSRVVTRPSWTPAPACPPRGL